MSPQCNNKVPSFLTMSFEMVTVRLGQGDEAVEIPVNLELLKAVSPYFGGAFEGGFKEATDRKIELTDVTEQTFRIFLQWAYAQLYSSGSEAPIPDQLILDRNTPEELEAASNDQNEGSDNEEENDSEHSSDHDSNHSPSQSSSHRSSYASLSSSHYARGGRHSLPTSFSSARLSRPLIDEAGCHPLPLYLPASCESIAETREKFELREKNYDMAQVSYPNLFVFADKYDVHQLGDDILTAMVVQLQAWNWPPDFNQDLLTLAYDNLPDSATYLKFMVQVTAHFWLLESTHSFNKDFDFDVAGRLRLLQKWRPDFAFEVGLAQSLTLQKSKDEHEVFSYDMSNPNSCVFHDHIGHDQAACRQRISDKAHVFAVLIESCSIDGMAMAEDQEATEALANLSISSPAADGVSPEC